jgi:hemoglobin
VDLFTVLGREEGCLRLSRSFYAKVADDPVLRPLFPGKSLRCASEELAAFLVQFFEGDEERTQYRWWLSLQESHARFKISEAQRAAWIRNMNATLEEFGSEISPLQDFFLRASLYIVGKENSLPSTAELADRWQKQLDLDRFVQHLAEGEDQEAILIAEAFAGRGALFVGVLAKMMETGRDPLLQYVRSSIQRDPSLINRRSNGRTLLHFAAGFGCEAVVQDLLAIGGDSNLLDDGGHTALYRVAGVNSEAGAAIVRRLVQFGADVNLSQGTMRATPLHEAARRGNTYVMRALLDAGADFQARDRKGHTPLDRAINMRRRTAQDLIQARVAQQAHR